MEFDNTSQEIWEDMRAGTPFSGPKREQGDYTEDFYGLNIAEPVDFLALEDFLVEFRFDQSLTFNYQDFALHPLIDLKGKLINAIDRGEMPSFVGNAQMTYLDQHKKKKTATFKIKLNRRVDGISPSFSHWITIDPVTSIIYADIRVFYVGTDDKRVLNPTTSDPDDFNIPDKYAAVVIAMYDLEEYMELCERLLDDYYVEHIKKEITDKYLAHLNKRHPANVLESLYAKMPHYIIDGIAQKANKLMLVKHLYLLKASDDSNWFTDTSGAILIILRLLCAGNLAFLYQLFVRHQTLVKALYYNMHGDSMIDGQKYPNRYLFVQLLSTVCSLNGFKGLINTGHKYYLGKYFQPDSNVDENYDPATDLIFLQQYKTVFNQISTIQRLYRVPINDMVQDQEAMTDGQYYHPLTIVKLYDLNNKDKLASPMLVPALFVKYFSDFQEWQDIMRNVRIGLDVLGVILGVVSLGTTSPLLFALAVADIGMSSADALLMLNDDLFKNSKEGREFLAAWDKVMAYSSIATVGPLVLKGVFIKGITLLKIAKDDVVRQFVQTSLKRVIREVNASHPFIQHQFRILASTNELIKESNAAFNLGFINSLLQADVTFLKRINRTTSQAKNEFAAVYEGQIIAYGSAKRLKKALSFLNKQKGILKGKAFTEALQKYLLAEGIVEYGKSKLSNLALNYRNTLTIQKHPGNVAVFEFIGKEGKLETRMFSTLEDELEWKSLGFDIKPHSEEIGIKWMRVNSVKNVKAIYSELEPCKLNYHKCKNKIAEEFPNAKVSFSFEFNNNPNVMKKAIADREIVLNNVLND